LSVTETLRTLSFWVLGACAFLTFFAMLGTLYQLPIYLSTVGVKQISAGYMAMLGAALIGKFLFGFLADRLGPKQVFIANMAVMAIGAALLALATPSSVFLALGVFGLGWGGLYTMLQLLTVQNFGLKATGKIMGLIAIFDCVGGGLGSFVMASIFDATQSYRPAFWMLCAMIVVAMLAATRIRQEFKA
jgi:nitrate/nitrite transporter NarK